MSGETAPAAATETVPTYSATEMPPEDANWGEFARVGTTRAIRITGPFQVVMHDGTPTAIEDGWLAIDADGQPYPITDSVFQKAYAPAPTFVERALALQAELEDRRAMAADPMTARALSIAITACEDMRSRYTESRARQEGVFAPADIDRIGAEAERAIFTERISAAATEGLSGE